MNSDTRTADREDYSSLRWVLFILVILLAPVLALGLGSRSSCSRTKEQVETRAMISYLGDLARKHGLRVADVQDSLRRCGEILDGDVFYLLTTGMTPEERRDALSIFVRNGSAAFRRGASTWTPHVESPELAADIERRTDLLMLDGWKRPLRVRVRVCEDALGRSMSLEVASAGADGKWFDADRDDGEVCDDIEDWIRVR